MPICDSYQLKGQKTSLAVLAYYEDNLIGLDLFLEMPSNGQNIYPCYTMEWPHRHLQCTSFSSFYLFIIYKNEKKKKSNTDQNITIFSRYILFSFPFLWSQITEKTDLNSPAAYAWKVNWMNILVLNRIWNKFHLKQAPLLCGSKFLKELLQSSGYYMLLVAFWNPTQALLFTQIMSILYMFL